MVILVNNHLSTDDNHFSWYLKFFRKFDPIYLFKQSELAK